MTLQLQSFLPQSWSRFISLVTLLREMSLLRALQYEHIQKLKFSGLLLDYGGGESATYREFIKGAEYLSVNIDPKIKPSWMIKPGECIPQPDETFDHILSMNTFEHIYDARSAIQECYRVLKKGGMFTAHTPFIFPVHGHPQDFFRPTPDWWNCTLTDCGFLDYKVVPISWGPFSTSSVISGLPGPFKKMRLIFSMLLDLFYSWLKKNPYDQEVKAPLGFAVFALKG